MDNWSRHNDCLIKFRTSHDNDDGSSTKLLFCLQTTWQQRLMHLYGEQMCLLDATYRTCRYSIPLFLFVSGPMFTMLWWVFLSSKVRPPLTSKKPFPSSGSGTLNGLQVILWWTLVRQKLVHWRLSSQVITTFTNRGLYP